jgi:glycosyltransferase involved in cell wall biosynthesis
MIGRGGPVTGLTRYTSKLYQELCKLPDANVELVNIDKSFLPYSLGRILKHYGADIETFLNNRPLTLPPVKHNIVHITRNWQATMLLQPTTHRIIITVHDLIPFIHRNNPNIRIYQSGLHSFLDWLSIQFCRRADALIADSDYTRQSLLSLINIPPERVHVIYLAIDHTAFRPYDVPDTFYARYGLDRDTPYILHISSEEPRKNVLTLIRAFAAVHQHYPHARLLKVGRSHFPAVRAAMRALIDELGLGDAVLLVDEVSDADLSAFYNIATLFVLPSFAEGFGFPALEAMACGTPVVAANCTALPEVVGGAGVLIDPANADDISQAIIRLLDDGQWRADLRQRGLRRAADFTWEHTASQVMEVYRRVAALSG